MSLARLFLILSVLLFGYCAVVGMILLMTAVPWAWVPITLFLTYLALRKTQYLSACGTARWADFCDLWGMVDGGNGLIIGEVDDTTTRSQAAKQLFDSSISARIAIKRFFGAFQKKRPQELVRLNNSPHVAIFAPTGAGKGVSFVVPFLLTCEDSCVVVDLKAGELARLTAAARRKMGQKIILLDPFKLITQTPDTLNPLDFIDKSSPFALEDCRETAAAMVERKDEKGDGVHFLDTTEGAFAAICAMLVQYGEGKIKSLQALCDVCSNPKNWELAIQRMCTSEAWDGLLARMGGNLMHLKERELASSMSTMARFLRFLSTPAIADSTRSSSFDPADLRNPKKKTTIYLILSPERAGSLSQLLRLWLGTLLRGAVKGGLQEKTKIHFVVDEANLVGKMDQISDALTIGRGFGIKLQLYYQDLGELKKCWPEGADQTLLANVSSVFFAVNDNGTANFVSEALGKSTIIVKSGGTSTGSSYTPSTHGDGGSTSYSSSSNDNWAQNARELLQPSEVRNLSPRVGICFTPGVRPIWTKLIRYYEPSFKNRSKKFWRSVNLFFQAAALLIILSGFAVGVTMIAQDLLLGVNQPFIQQE